MATTLNAGTSTSGAAISADTTGILQLQSGSTPTTAVTIDASQNVGIGTTSPATKLNVIGDLQLSRSATASDAAINFGNNTNNYIYGGNGNNLMAFATNGAERMRMDSSGNVGIGTSSPSQRLDVSGEAQLSYAGGTNYLYFQSTSNYVGRNTTGDIWLNAVGGQAVVFGIGGSEKARVDGNGNLLVGTTTAQAAKIVALTTGGASISCAQTGTSGDQIYFRTSTSTLAGYITCPTATTTSYVSISDYRLKENTTPMTGALAKISALKPCTYTWKADGSAGQGFIAHELQAVIPDCVVGEKDAINEDGSIKPQGIDTSFLVATLTAAIQELKAELDATKAEVAALKVK